MSKPSTDRKTLSYWAITLLAWLVVAAIAWPTFQALLDGDVVEFVLGLLLLTYIVLSIIQPRWLIRAATWVKDARGL